MDNPDRLPWLGFHRLVMVASAVLLLALAGVLLYRAGADRAAREQAEAAAGAHRKRLDAGVASNARRLNALEGAVKSRAKTKSVAKAKGHPPGGAGR